MYVNDRSYNINITNTMFNNCSSSSQAGSISSISKNMVLIRVCAFKCIAANYYAFSYSDSLNDHIFKYLSVTMCSHNHIGEISVSIAKVIKT